MKPTLPRVQSKGKGRINKEGIKSRKIKKWLERKVEEGGSQRKGKERMEGMRGRYNGRERWGQGVFG